MEAPPLLPPRRLDAGSSSKRPVSLKFLLRARKHMFSPPAMLSAPPEAPLHDHNGNGIKEPRLTLHRPVLFLYFPPSDRQHTPSPPRTGDWLFPLSKTPHRFRSQIHRSPSLLSHPFCLNLKSNRENLNKNKSSNPYFVFDFTGSL